MTSEDSILHGATAGVILEDLQYAVARATNYGAHAGQNVMSMKKFARDQRTLTAGEIRELGVAMSVRTGRLKRWQQVGPLDLFPVIQHPLWLENVELQLESAAKVEMEYQAKLRVDVLDALVPKTFNRPLSLLELRDGISKIGNSANGSGELLEGAIDEVSQSVQAFFDAFRDHPRLRRLDQDQFGDLTIEATTWLNSACNQMARDFVDQRMRATEALDAMSIDHNYAWKAHPYPFEFN